MTQDELKNVYEILNDVYRNSAFSQIALNDRAEHERSAFVVRCAYGVIENDLYLDYVIKQHVKAKPQTQVLLILKIGVYLLKFLNTPPHIAVNATVEFIKSTPKRAASGFVNAVLKNIATSETSLPKKKEDFLSVKYSYPLWFVRKLLSEYDADIAEEFLSMQKPKLATIRVNHNKTSCKEFETLLQRENVEYETTVYENAFRADYAALFKKREYASLYTVQSLSSMAVVESAEVQSEFRVLDVCAAPGGKAVYAAEKACEVIACDLYPHRVKLIDAYAKRMGISNLRSETADAAENMSKWNKQFDVVLCDVPCSGFATAYKKPDLKRTRTEEDVRSLNRLQKSILENACKYVREGGKLVYSTCTMLREENRDIADAFLQLHPEFEVVANADELLPGIRQNGYLQMLPRQGFDAFFIAVLRRKKGG